MKHFPNPRCEAPDPYDERSGVCGVEMRLEGERHPLWQPRHWVFVCPRCEAARVLTEDQLKRLGG
jgi:hypothetical protein